MIRSIDFPPDATAEIAAKLVRAGKGATLRVIPRSTKDGTGIEFLIGVRSATPIAAADLFDGCDEEPTDSSHLCPGPLCPPEPGP